MQKKFGPPNSGEAAAAICLYMSKEKGPTGAASNGPFRAICAGSRKDIAVIKKATDSI